MKNYVSEKTVTAQDVNALYSLVNAGANGVSIPREPLAMILDAALAAYPNKVALVILKANFLLNVVGDYAEAEHLLERSVTLSPSSPMMWRNLIELKLAGGKLLEAEHAIARLEQLNRFGQQDKAVNKYRKLLAEKWIMNQSGEN